MAASRDETTQEQDMEPLTEFHPFPRLPWELRNEIWTHALVITRVYRWNTMRQVIKPESNPRAVAASCKEARRVKDRLDLLENTEGITNFSDGQYSNRRPRGNMYKTDVMYVRPQDLIVFSNNDYTGERALPNGMNPWMPAPNWLRLLRHVVIHLSALTLYNANLLKPGQAVTFNNCLKEMAKQPQLKTIILIYRRRTDYRREKFPAAPCSGDITLAAETLGKYTYRRVPGSSPILVKTRFFEEREEGSQLTNGVLPKWAIEWSKSLPQHVQEKLKFIEFGSNFKTDNKYRTGTDVTMTKGGILNA